MGTRRSGGQQDASSPDLPFSSDTQLCQRVLQASNCPFVVTDCLKPDNPIVYANRAMEELTGYSATELFGRNPRLFHKDRVNQPGLTQLRKSVQRQESCTVMIQDFRKDGAAFWTELSVTPVKDENGKATHFIGVHRALGSATDIEPHILEQALKFCPVSVIITDFRQPDNPIVFANEAFERISLYSFKDVLGLNPRFLHGDKNNQEGHLEIRTAIASGKSWRIFAKTAHLTSPSFPLTRFSTELEKSHILSAYNATSQPTSR